MNSTTDKTDLEAVMRRVQKLLAIAGDSRANPHEAAAAAMQAEKIMRKYQLEHVDVMRMDFANQQNFDTVDAECRMKKGAAAPPQRVPLWAQGLAITTARLHDCQVRQHSDVQRGALLRFAGYKADVQLCGWTFDYLVSAVIRACRAFQREQHRDKTESESYRQGFVAELKALLRSAKNTKDAEQRQSVTSRDLVTLKMHAVAEKFGDAKYGHRTRAAIKDGAAFARGEADGARVDVGRRAVAGNGASNLRLAA